MVGANNNNNSNNKRHREKVVSLCGVQVFYATAQQQQPMYRWNKAVTFVVCFCNHVYIQYIHTSGDLLCKASAAAAATIVTVQQCSAIDSHSHADSVQ